MVLGHPFNSWIQKKVTCPFTSMSENIQNMLDLALKTACKLHTGCGLCLRPEIDGSMDMDMDKTLGTTGNPQQQAYRKTTVQGGKSRFCLTWLSSASACPSCSRATANGRKLELGLQRHQSRWHKPEDGIQDPYKPPFGVCAIYSEHYSPQGLLRCDQAPSTSCSSLIGDFLEGCTAHQF